MKITRVSFAVMAILLVLVVGFWWLQRHIVVSYAKTNLAHAYRVSESEVTIERVQELGFWRNKVNIFAGQSWNIEFTVPGGPKFNSGVAYTGSIDEPTLMHFKSLVVVFPGAPLAK